MKNFTKTLVFSFIFLFAFSLARPAKAFYLEVPQSVKNLLSLLQSNKATAQDAGTIAPPPNTGSYSSYGSPTAPVPPQQPLPPQGMMPPSGDQNNQYQGTGPMPGQNQGYQGIGNPPGMQGGQGQNGPSPEQQAKQLAQMKRSMKQMGSMVKQFETMIASAEKKGTAVPEEIKQNLAKLKEILASVANAKSMEDLQDVDMSAMQDLTQSLEDFRRNVMEAQQRLDGMKRGMKGMEQGLKMFETQIARLAKSKVVVPAEITENLAKLKALIEQVKTAKTAEEMDAIDFDSIQDLMQSMDENRQQLEQLARWPQSLKQIDRQLVQLTSALKRSKSIVASLAKKGIDLQSEYTAFEEAINKLKSVRDDAVAKMAAGNSEEAFSTLEDDFFGQMDDVWQNQKVIMTMSNLGRFSSEFKQGINQAKATINRLKRQKIDTADLAALLAQANEKGQEVLSLLKAKPLDADTVSGALDELENIKQEFEAKVSELTGQEEALPWEQGPQQFKRVDLPQGFDKFIPQKPQETQQQQSVELQTP